MDFIVKMLDTEIPISVEIPVEECLQFKIVFQKVKFKSKSFSGFISLEKFINSTDIIVDKSNLWWNEGLLEDLASNDKDYIKSQCIDVVELLLKNNSNLVKILKVEKLQLEYKQLVEGLVCLEREKQKLQNRISEIVNDENYG